MSQSQNWYEIPVELPMEYISWVATNIPARYIKEIPSPHITILYGFDPKYYDEIDKIVKSFEITPKDYTFGEPKRGDVSPVWILPVKSEKITSLFWYLHKKFDNQHTLINGKFDPHVTLCSLNPKSIPSSRNTIEDRARLDVNQIFSNYMKWLKS